MWGDVDTGTWSQTFSGLIGLGQTYLQNQKPQPALVWGAGVMPGTQQAVGPDGTIYTRGQPVPSALGSQLASFLPLILVVVVVVVAYRAFK
jgi:hypothetical protein